MGRRSLRFQGTPITVLWRASGGEVTALVAGPRYQQRRWFDPVLRASDFSSVRIVVSDRGSGPIFGAPSAAGLPTTLRSATATALPWDISVTTAGPDSALSGFAQRREFMIFGLAVVVLFVIAASYFAGRAVSRELAAATLQTDFVSAVSHEFRTPLTSMKQFTEILVEDGDLPAEERRTYYRAQERATRRLSRLVESLLDFGRMEAGARPYLQRKKPAVDRFYWRRRAHSDQHGSGRQHTAVRAFPGRSDDCLHRQGRRGRGALAHGGLPPSREGSPLSDEGKELCLLWQTAERSRRALPRRGDRRRTRRPRLGDRRPAPLSARWASPRIHAEKGHRAG